MKFRKKPVVSETAERCPDCGEILDDNRMCSQWREVIRVALAESEGTLEDIK